MYISQRKSTNITQSSLNSPFQLLKLSQASSISNSKITQQKKQQHKNHAQIKIQVNKLFNKTKPLKPNKRNDQQQLLKLQLNDQSMLEQLSVHSFADSQGQKQDQHLLKIKGNKTKTFQQLYLQKIKQIKRNKTTISQGAQFIDKKERVFPLSCKSSTYILNKNRLNTKQTMQIKSTKNIKNKQNINLQINNTQKYFKKPSQSQKKPQQKKKLFILKKTINKIDNKQQNNNQLEQIFQQVIKHQQHQHIWGGKECFLVQKEFHLFLYKVLTNKSIRQHNISIVIKTIWKHLAGDNFGGVVKYNILQFLNIIFANNHLATAQPQIKQSTSLHNQHFINDSTLKLVVLNEQEKIKINRTYKVLMSKSQDGEALKQEDHSVLCQPLLLPLGNHAYLQQVSQKHDSPEQFSPPPPSPVSMCPDFSPKLSSHMQPFQSTILQRTQSMNLINPLSQFYQHTSHNANKPLLSVDVNLGDRVEKIIVYEGQTPYDVSMRLVRQYHIDQALRGKFQTMLSAHIRNLLFKIQEVSQQLFEQDSQQLTNQL